MRQGSTGGTAEGRSSQVLGLVAYTEALLLDSVACMPVTRGSVNIDNIVHMLENIHSKLIYTRGI